MQPSQNPQDTGLALIVVWITGPPGCLRLYFWCRRADEINTSAHRSIACLLVYRPAWLGPDDVVRAKVDRHEHLLELLHRGARCSGADRRSKKQNLPKQAQLPQRTDELFAPC